MSMCTETMRVRPAHGHIHLSYRACHEELDARCTANIRTTISTVVC